MKIVSHSIQETHAAATELARIIAEGGPRDGATVIALSGELGAGKTAFSQGLARALGVSRAVVSPTFLLMKRYDLPDKGSFQTLYHLDCYRLRDYRDLETLDMHTLFSDSRNIIVIEWAERVREALPKRHISVHLEHGGDDKREITIHET